MRTVAGPAQGSMELAARDLAGGTLPGSSDFELEITAHLDAGETLHFDGMILVP